MKQSFNNNLIKAKIKIMITYVLVYTAFGTIFYPILPFFMKFEPLILNTQFEFDTDGMLYYQSYFGILLFLNILGVIFINYFFEKKLSKLLDLENDNRVNNLFDAPYIIYLFQSLSAPLIIILVVQWVTELSWIEVLKEMIIFSILTTVTSQITLIFSRNIFHKLLVENYFKISIDKIHRMNLKLRVSIHFLPILIIAIIFTTLIGYSLHSKEKSDLLFQFYKIQLDQISDSLNYLPTPENVFNNISFIQDNMKDDMITFVINPNQDIKTSNNLMLDSYFLKYLKEISPTQNYRIVESYSQIEGVASILKYNNEDYIIGVQYKIEIKNMFLHYLISMITFLGFCIFILRYFSKSISEDIILISNKLNEISIENSNKFENKLSILSGDEFSYLAKSFNNLLDKEKINYQQIQKTHNIIIEQEKLVSLGNLVGGMAHNIRTPIMAISGGVEGISDLSKEYITSISNPDVTIEDHNEISNEMIEWTSKIRVHCNYVTQIIKAVKGQISKHDNDSEMFFTIDELIDRMKILMNFELTLNNCKLEIENLLNDNVKIKGDISSLIQVINNLIQNSIYAYENKGGIITFKIIESNNEVILSVVDNGTGMPENVKDTLFKEMKTTKGKKGTGLGLYISYSTIIGMFSGKMWFESQLNKGTTFYISIPISKIK